MNQPTDLIEFVGDRLGHDFRYAIDASRAKNELGWKAQKNLLSDLPKVVDWYMKD
jgi:dTDP-glucose 4,6-dehydratase